MFMRPDKARLTTPGLVFCVITFLTLLAAWNTGINLYYIVFSALLSFVVLSYFTSRWSLAKVTVMRETPGAVHRDAVFPTTVRIGNEKRLLPSAAIRVESSNRPGLSEGFALSIPRGQFAVLRVMERYEKRGVYPVPETVLVTRFPFGLLERRRSFHHAGEIVVYPRVGAVRPSVLDLGAGGSSRPRKSTGEGDEFFGLREYVRGDDPRRIAWRASAKSHNLLVKELAQETSRYVAIILDSRYKPQVEGFRDRFEESIELVASIAITLLQRQYWVSVTTASHTLAFGEGPSQQVKVLDTLARLQVGDADAAHPFHHAATEEGRFVTFLHVSPDPADWGESAAPGGARVMRPDEVVYA